MEIAGAEDDRIDLLRPAALEVGRLVLDPLDDGDLLPVARPLEAHGLGPIAVGDRLGAVLVALRADVFGGIAGAEDQQILVDELQGVPEIVGMEDAPVEAAEALVLGHVRRREVTAGDDDVVELLGVLLVFHQVVDRDGEALGVFVVLDPADRRPEADVVAHAGFLDPALDVVPQHRARRIGGQRPAEVLVEGVVGELQALLRPVRPEIAVHGAVDGLAVLVDAGAPGVVPQAAPIVLLLETDEFRNFSALARRRLKGPQLGETGRPGANNCDTRLHPILLRLGRPAGLVLWFLLGSGSCRSGRLNQNQPVCQNSGADTAHS